jgi:hypothetical protein
MRFIRGRHAVAIGLGLAVLALAAVLWFPATSGSKQEDLGASLAGGLLVGAVLVYVQLSFTRTVQDTDSKRALEPIPASLIGPTEVSEPESTYAGLFSVSDTAVPGVEHHPPPAWPIKAVYLGSQPDTSKVDAYEMRLQLRQGTGEDFQVVTVVVPTKYLMIWTGGDPRGYQQQIWWGIANAAKPIIRSAIHSGHIPLEDPTVAFEVPIFGDKLRRAVTRARSDKNPTHVANVGESVFEIPS